MTNSTTVCPTCRGNRWVLHVYARGPGDPSGNQRVECPDCKNSTTAEQDFRTLVSAVRSWVDNHMDQWEKFKYEDQYGPLYVTISRATDYPDSFDPLPVENHHGQ